MTTQINKSPSSLMWITSIAIVLFCGVGTAAFMGWLPTAFGSPSIMPVAALAATKPIHKTHTHVANTNPSRVMCTECGVIESVRVVNGGGRGRDVATIAGAAGDAVAGNAIEKNVGSTRSYEVIVHLDDGSKRVFNEENPPAWQSGDHVRVVDGTIRSNG